MTERPAAADLDAEGREPQDTAAPAPGADAPSSEAGAAASAPEPGDPAGDLAGDLAVAQAAVAALTNDVQRLQAEYVNYKRRVDRDRELVKENATWSVLSSLMPVLDDLDRAREHGELEGGFKAIADSLERIVASNGLVKFGQPGEEFDPRVHEALMHGSSDEVTTTVVADLVTAGYRIGERVLRPARVTVVGPASADGGDA